MVGTGAHREARLRTPTGADRALLAARLAPLLVLLPVAGGMGLAFIRLLGTTHPVYGWSMSINADAEAMYLGIWPYRDPAEGFTPDAYTPLYPAVTSLLDHVTLWTGWPIVLTMLSAAGIAALIGSLAYRPRSDRGGGRVLALAEAAGIGALATSFIFGLLRDSFYEARADHFTSLLGFAAIMLTPRAARGGVGAKAAVIALLTAAFWAKQTALLFSVAFCGVLVLMVWSRRLPPRSAVTWAAPLLAINVALIAVLHVLTDGWQTRFNFEVSLPATRSVIDVLPDFLDRAAPALAFLAVAAALAWLAGGRLVRSSDRTFLVAGMLFVALLGGAAGLYLRRFSGGDDNNYIPCLWALGALGAVAYGRAASRPPTAAMAAALVALVALSPLLPGDGRWRLREGDVIPDTTWADLPSDVREYARSHLVWDAVLSDLNVEPQRAIHPNALHIQEALIRDARPKAFERALLGRRFDGVFGYAGGIEDLGEFEGLAWEDNYFWKLNQVVRLKYGPAPRPLALPAGEPYGSLEPTPLRVRRAGPDPAPWIDGCFGPFRLAGREFQIHRGGGLWCVDSQGVLTMRGTPADVTELVSRKPVATVRGTLRAGLAPRLGGWRIERDGGWALRALVRTKRTGMTFDLAVGGRRVGRATVPASALRAAGGEVEIAFRAGARPSLAPSTVGGASLNVVLPPPERSGKLHFWATRDSDARFNLKDLRAE
jgi:hypothetical protein